MKYSEALMRHPFPRSRRWSRLHVGAARIAIAERFGMRQSLRGFDARCLARCGPSRRRDCLASVEELAVHRVHGWRRHRED